MHTQTFPSAPSPRAPSGTFCPPSPLEAARIWVGCSNTNPKSPVGISEQTDPPAPRQDLSSRLLQPLLVVRKKFGFPSSTLFLKAWRTLSVRPVLLRPIWLELIPGLKSFRRNNERRPGRLHRPHRSQQNDESKKHGNGSLDLKWLLPLGKSNLSPHLTQI